MENTFKSSVFGGFNRDDVIRYIEKTSLETKQQIEQLEQESDGLCRENAELRNKLAAAAPDVKHTVFRRADVFPTQRRALFAQLDRRAVVPRGGLEIEAALARHAVAKLVPLHKLQPVGRKPGEPPLHAAQVVLAATVGFLFSFFLARPVVHARSLPVSFLIV